MREMSSAPRDPRVKVLTKLLNDAYADGEEWISVSNVEKADTDALSLLDDADPLRKIWPDVVRALKEVAPYFNGEHDHDHPSVLIVNEALDKIQKLEESHEQ